MAPALSTIVRVSAVSGITATAASPSPAAPFPSRARLARRAPASGPAASSSIPSVSPPRVSRGARVASRASGGGTGIPPDGVRGMLARLRGGGGGASSSSSPAAAAAQALDGTRFDDTAPSWETLGRRLETLQRSRGTATAAERDLERDPAASPHALARRFGSDDDAPVRVMFYRDHAGWCPYCEKIWLQLEEKKIPYRVEKINMRCYGDKPALFTSKVPSGMLPVVEIDGELMTESAAIAAALEERFPERTPLLPARGTAAFARIEELNRLERALFSRWMRWLTSSWADGGNRSQFEEAMDVVDAELRKTPGAYFLGEELSLVDITFTPFLERMAASLAYYKGFKIEQSGGRWPGLDAWYRAMALRSDTYAWIKSDYYTHAHDLPPQLGGCEFNGDDEQARPLTNRIAPRHVTFDHVISSDQ